MNDTMFLIRMDNKGITCKTWRLLVIELMNFIHTDEEYSIFEVYKIDYHKQEDCEVALDCADVTLVCDEYDEIKKIVYPLNGGNEYILDAYKVRMDFICESLSE